MSLAPGLEPLTTGSSLEVQVSSGSTVGIEALDTRGSSLELKVSHSETDHHECFDAAIRANRASSAMSLLRKASMHVKKPKVKNLARNTKKKSRKARPHIKGKVIDGKHEQYLLTLGMMMGMQVSIAQIIDQPPSDQPPTPADFMATCKWKFPPRGSAATPAHSLAHTFKFKDYSPKGFQAVRDIFKVNREDYVRSLCGTENFVQFISNSKSNQYFFYSHDGSYLIKTQTPQEVRLLRRILPKYYRHLRQHPGSLITRFLGMSRVKFYHLRRKVHFVVMMSVHPTALDVGVTYDLKGCTHGRRSTVEERERDGRLKMGLHLKDLDLIDDNFKLRLGAERRAVFVEQLRHDVEFLAALRIMDYSLLIGIHDREADGRSLADSQKTAPPSRAHEASQASEELVGERDQSSEEVVVGERADSVQGCAEVWPLCEPSEVDLDAASDEDFSDDEDDLEPDHDPALARALDSRVPASDPRRGTGLCALTRRRDLGIASAASASAEEPDCVYFMGLIDILITYGSYKSAETFFKTLRIDKASISSVPPEFYAKRFLEFVEKLTV